MVGTAVASTGAGADVAVAVGVACPQATKTPLTEVRLISFKASRRDIFLMVSPHSFHTCQKVQFG
jgi:hypothetical protein